jgi:hypothetical protein
MFGGIKYNTYKKYRKTRGLQKIKPKTGKSPNEENYGPLAIQSLFWV